MTPLVDPYKAPHPKSPRIRAGWRAMLVVLADGLSHPVDELRKAAADSPGQLAPATISNLLGRARRAGVLAPYRRRAPGTGPHTRLLPTAPAEWLEGKPEAPTDGPQVANDYLWFVAHPGVRYRRRPYRRGDSAFRSTEMRLLTVAADITRDHGVVATPMVDVIACTTGALICPFIAIGEDTP